MESTILIEFTMNIQYYYKKYVYVCRKPLCRDRYDITSKTALNLLVLYYNILHSSLQTLDLLEKYLMEIVSKHY